MTISEAVLNRALGLRFKRRSDLMKFASKYPGALGAQFLAQVQEKSSRGAPRRTSEYHRIDLSTWASSGTHLKELRDQREVHMLTRILTQLNHQQLPQAVDAIALRLREILLAKGAAKEASWEKAAVVSPLPSGVPSNAPIPDNAFTLP